MEPHFAAGRELLQRAIADRVFPCAVVEAGTSTQPLWQDAVGALTYEPNAPPASLDTIFDLASLTKVLATAPLAMRAIEQGALALEDRAAMHLPQWTGADRLDVTIRDLLAHCAGLPAHRELFLQHRGVEAFVQAISLEPLEYPPGTRSIYSDLGYILLGAILAAGTSLAERFDGFKRQTASAQDLQFLPPDIWRRRTAPARFDPWRGRRLIGEVDDSNAFALGGAAGHAGLFGTAMAVGDQARHLLQVLDGRAGAFGQEMARTFITRRVDVPNSSRALAWDTMLTTSSCGTRMSPRAFGHTGFTGTSLWIDPDRGLYVVLLTNRVYGDGPEDGTADGIAGVRRAFHDAVIDAWLAR